MKITKEINSEPIIIGDRIINITLELTTFVKNRNLTKSENIVLTGLTLEPLYMKVIEGEDEWIHTFKKACANEMECTHVTKTSCI